MRHNRIGMRDLNLSFQYRLDLRMFRCCISSKTVLKALESVVSGLIRGALIMKIGFWGSLCYEHHKETPQTVLVIS